MFQVTQAPLLQHLQGYAGGEFLAPTKKSFAVLDPSTQEALCKVSWYDGHDAQQAIHHAESAMTTPLSLDERRKFLVEIAKQHTIEREQLASIITAENGKPFAEALAEVDYAAGFYSEAACSLGCLEPRRLGHQLKGHQWTVFSRAAGVAGLIVPWNFPLAMLAKKASAALAAGCSIVVKPSEKTPLSSIALFHIFDRLGLPNGLVNLVFGDAPKIGVAFCEHPAVRVISFTGSTPVGKLLAQQAAPHVKRLALELGGNAPFIVFADADLKHAAGALMANKFRCSGQTCVCTNRVYVHRDIAAEFAALLAPQVAALRVGSGSSKESDLGPLIDVPGFNKVLDLVDDALSRGARALVGGLPTSSDDGLFYPPTLLESVPRGARCLKEEMFGPVVALVTFDSDDEVIRAANDTEYGLAAYLFTADASHGLRIAEQLSFGHVGLNTATGPIPSAPFGGMKQSGLGREGGDEGLLEFVELQTIPTPWIAEKP